MLAGIVGFVWKRHIWQLFFQSNQELWQNSRIYNIILQRKCWASEGDNGTMSNLKISANNNIPKFHVVKGNSAKLNMRSENMIMIDLKVEGW